MAAQPRLSPLTLVDAPPAAPERTTHQVVNDALTAANGNWEQACEIVWRALAETPDRSADLRAVRLELLRLGIRQYVRQVTHKQRTRLMARHVSPGAPPRPLPVADTTGLTALALHNLLDYPLTGALKLRDAKKQDVLDAAQAQFTMARRSDERGRWLSLVADRVPYGKRVGDVLTDPELRDLQAKAVARV